MRALLLVIRGSRLTAPLVELVREKGFEPFVLTSAPSDGGAAFRAVCADLGVEHAVSESLVLTTDEAVEAALAIDDCRFCFSIADQQRLAMATANAALGARDIAPAAATAALDKHVMRAELARAGLTRLDSFRLSDPELRARLDRGERHIVKPRSGAGSLCVRSVTSWAQAHEQEIAFRRGPGAGATDIWTSYYSDNELVAETFFDGRELSVEVFRQGGRTLLAIEHEKTVLDFTGETVLERGFASPPVTLPAEHVRAARALTDAALGALGLDEGCYHVEVRVAASGECEIVEVNPRIGGGYVFESVRRQTGRVLSADWVDGLVGTPVPAAAERGCGVYLQNLYPEPGRVLAGHVPNPRVPVPDAFADVLPPGSVVKADRGDRAAMALWTTDLATHADTVARLAEDCVSFLYADEPITQVIAEPAGPNPVTDAAAPRS